VSEGCESGRHCEGEVIEGVLDLVDVGLVEDWKIASGIGFCFVQWTMKLMLGRLDCSE